MNKFLILILVIALTSCGVKSPVLYPNETYNQIGKDQADQIVKDCISQAKELGVENEEHNKKVLKNTGIGTVAGAATGAAAGSIRGNAGPAALTGAVVAGVGSFTHGMLSEKEPDKIYKSFVETCIDEKGLKLVGWN